MAKSINRNITKVVGSPSIRKVASNLVTKSKKEAQKQVEGFLKSQVVSTHLKEVGYDTKRNTLYITFHNNVVYAYYNVKKVTYTLLLKSNSKGSYFHRNIKDRYRTRKLGRNYKID